MTNYYTWPKLDSYIRKHSDFVSYLIILIVAIVLFDTAPKNGEFSWSESPRNALNGAFILDFLKELPFDNPVDWAKRYYYQYPAHKPYQ